MDEDDRVVYACFSTGTVASRKSRALTHAEYASLAHKTIERNIKKRAEELGKKWK